MPTQGDGMSGVGERWGEDQELNEGADDII